MNITILKKNNDQFPPSSESELGDLAMLSNGDVFCYMEDHWFMLGGRWVLPRIKHSFFNYVRTGWPDSKSLEYDLEAVFDLSVFETPPAGGETKYEDISLDPIWIKNFTDKIIQTCVAIERKKSESKSF